MNAKRYRKILLTALGSSLLAGCASLDGAPQPIIPVVDNLKVLQNHGIEKAIQNFHGDDAARDTLNKRQYRDMVIAIYLNAIDARYQEFRRLISGEGRGGAIGADLGIIGLSTAATLFERSASDLSAVSAALAGGKGTVDKALYFDRALPAIMASMDKERAKVRKHIVSSMRNNESDYPLEVAFGDLAAYEAAASIDRAIDSITTDAAAGREIETVALENVIQACRNPDDLREEFKTIAGILSKQVSDKKPENIRKIAEAEGIKLDETDGVSASDLRHELLDRLAEKFCNKSDATVFINRNS